MWVVDPKALTLRSQAVKVAGAEGNDAVIVGGLKAGDLVVTAGVHVLNAGQKVKLFVDPSAPVAQAPGTPVHAK